MYLRAFAVMSYKTNHSIKYMHVSERGYSTLSFNKNIGTYIMRRSLRFCYRNVKIKTTLSFFCLV